VRQELPEVEKSIRFIGVSDLAADINQVAGEISRAARGSRLPIFYLGRQSYRPVWELQRRLHAWRVTGKIPDVVLLLEHQPVYTLGKNADERHLLASRPVDAEVVVCDRGGDVTYHGPGQIVGYPIVHLGAFGKDIHKYLRMLEETLLRTLDRWRIMARRWKQRTGVWVENEKIASIGVAVTRWVAYHGFALNVTLDLAAFEAIVPCGLHDVEMTSVAAELGDAAPAGLGERAREAVADAFGRRWS